MKINNKILLYSGIGASLIAITYLTVYAFRMKKYAESQTLTEAIKSMKDTAEQYGKIDENEIPDVQNGDFVFNNSDDNLSGALISQQQMDFETYSGLGDY